MHKMEQMLQAAEARHAHTVQQQQAEQLAALISALHKAEQSDRSAGEPADSPRGLRQLLTSCAQPGDHQPGLQRHAASGKLWTGVESDAPDAVVCRQYAGKQPAQQQPASTASHLPPWRNDALLGLAEAQEAKSPSTRRAGRHSHSGHMQGSCA